MNLDSCKTGAGGDSESKLTMGEKNRATQKGGKGEKIRQRKERNSK